MMLNDVFEKRKNEGLEIIKKLGGTKFTPDDHIKKGEELFKIDRFGNKTALPRSREATIQEDDIIEKVPSMIMG